MDIFFSEYGNDYSRYLFGYAVYCEQETASELPKIYDKGFLPYTGNPTLAKNIFYLARSLRVNLKNFKDTSENRRVNRKIEPLDIEIEMLSKSSVTLTNEMVDFCLSYAKERFVDGEMNRERLEYIWDKDFFTHILHFRQAGKNIGYVFCCISGDLLHYWYSFFDITMMTNSPIGKWMMWRTIVWAKEQNLGYVYLGTCYRKKSLYKVRDFAGVEFFAGSGWDDNTAELKTRCKEDEK